VTHLGQRLSALIDGELDIAERERVLIHMARCSYCRDEVAALRMLKRRMNALGEAAAGAGLTGRLIGLRDCDLDEMAPAAAVWPRTAPLGDWQGPDPRQQGGDKHDMRAGRYFVAGTFALFLAGLGTAALIAGGEPQARAPAPPVTPSVDVLVVPHGELNQGAPIDPQRPAVPDLRPASRTRPSSTSRLP
jgi:anti-sigma factor RsiW